MKEIYLSLKKKQQQQGERNRKRDERDLKSIFNRESLTNEHQ
jgi:hypothetical protein